MARIIVGMSGGVDSAVAAMLLRDAGHHVTGLFMKNWNEDDGTAYCTAAVDLLDAEAVCHRLGIDLLTANFARQYWDNVFEHFLSEYRRGRTPNPDVLCNSEIKFKVFLEYASNLGADFIATGHYARLLAVRDSTHGDRELHKALDTGKDQTYFLHAVPMAQLSRCLFPLGGLSKRLVRGLAERAGLHIHARKDSTGICFIGERRFADFLQRFLPAQPGPIESAEGHAVGEHHGLMYYTLGQRQGIGIGGLHGGSGAPWYVVNKDLARNALIVAQGQNHPHLHSDVAYTESVHWLIEPPTLPFRCMAKTRYRQPDQRCTVAASASGLKVQFDAPQRAITPGQYIAFYRGTHCLGGAAIDSAHRATL